MPLPRLAPLALLVLCAFAAPAMEVRNEAQFAIAAGTNTDTATYVMCEEATIDGTARDDLFVMAQACSMSGRAENDLWVMADQVQIGGTVRDHARLAGNSISVSGRVDNGFLAAGASIQLATQSVIHGGAVLVAQTAALAGQVDGGLKVTASQCTLAGAVKGDVRIIANDIVVMPGTLIEGDLRYTSAESLVLDPSVILRGELVRVPLTAPAEETRVPWKILVLRETIFLAGAILCGVMLLVFFPLFTGRAVFALRSGPARCGLAGAIGFALLAMAAVAAAVTLVGLPLSLLIAGLLASLFYLGKVVVALSLGALLLRWRGPQPFARAFAALLVGLPPLYLAALLPDFGGSFQLVISLVGLGAFLIALWRPAPPAAA